MDTRQRWVAAVAAVYAVSWLLPVAAEGARIGSGIPGWEALRVALLPLWPYQDLAAPDGAVQRTLSVLSALSNVLFVAASAVALRQPSGRRALVWLAAALAGAAAVNAHWLWSAAQGMLQLHIGYYLWLGAFAAQACVLATMAVQTARDAAAGDRDASLRAPAM